MICVEFHGALQCQSKPPFSCFCCQNLCTGVCGCAVMCMSVWRPPPQANDAKGALLDVLCRVLEDSTRSAAGAEDDAAEGRPVVTAEAVQPQKLAADLARIYTVRGWCGRGLMGCGPWVWCGLVGEQGPVGPVSLNASGVAAVLGRGRGA